MTQSWPEWERPLDAEQSRERLPSLTGVLDAPAFASAAASHADFFMAAENSGEAILITDAHGVINYVNAAFLKATGHSRDEVIGRTPRFLKSLKHDPHFYRELWRKLAAGESWSGRLANRAKDGTLFEGDARISPVRGRADRISAYVAVCRDLTEEIMLRQQLGQAQKMESIGTLAGGIAHDFNNILQAILGYTDIAMLHAPEGSVIRSHLDVMLKAVNRAKSLIAQIMTFSRQGDRELRPVQMQLLVRDALKLMRATLPTTIEIRQRISRDAGYVLAAPSHIHQIVMNLCTNAWHAMLEHGGTITVTLEPVTISRASAHPMSAQLAAGDYVLLEISDTGMGMDPATLARIFEPYFTTKSRDQGTGLGLAVIHGIVTGCGGTIAAESRPGEGSVFRIHLPRCAQEAGAESMVAPPLSKGNGHILMIDDEPMLLDLGRKMLTHLGYKVTSCGFAKEALRMIETPGHDIDLVLTDQTMPVMTGTQLAAEIHKLHPELPIILVTGYNDMLAAESVSLDGISDLIAKPIALRELGVVISRVLKKKPA